MRETFEGIVGFLQNDVGNADINAHLNDCSSRATYTSVASVDQFLKYTSEKLNTVTYFRVIAACAHSLLADDTTDTADRIGMSSFIRYFNFDTQKVKEEYLGFVETVMNKGAEALYTNICEVLVSKDILITKISLHVLNGTNAMSGEHFGLQ